LQESHYLLCTQIARYKHVRHSLVELYLENDWVLQFWPDDSALCRLTKVDKAINLNCSIAQWPGQILRSQLREKTGPYLQFAQNHCLISATYFSKLTYIFSFFYNWCSSRKLSSVFILATKPRTTNGLNFVTWKHSYRTKIHSTRWLLRNSSCVSESGENYVAASCG